MTFFKLNYPQHFVYQNPVTVSYILFVPFLFIFALDKKMSAFFTNETIFWCSEDMFHHTQVFFILLLISCLLFRDYRQNSIRVRVLGAVMALCIFITFPLEIIFYSGKVSGLSLSLWFFVMYQFHSRNLLPIIKFFLKYTKYTTTSLYASVCNSIMIGSAGFIYLSAPHPSKMEKWIMLGGYFYAITIVYIFKLLICIYLINTFLGGKEFPIYNPLFKFIVWCTGAEFFTKIKITPNSLTLKGVIKKIPPSFIPAITGAVAGVAALTGYNYQADKVQERSEQADHHQMSMQKDQIANDAARTAARTANQIEKSEWAQATIKSTHDKTQQLTEKIAIDKIVLKNTKCSMLKTTNCQISQEKLRVSIEMNEERLAAAKRTLAGLQQVEKVSLEKLAMSSELEVSSVGVKALVNSFSF